MSAIGSSAIRLTGTMSWTGGLARGNVDADAARSNAADRAATSHAGPHSFDLLATAETSRTADRDADGSMPGDGQPAGSQLPNSGHEQSSKTPTSPWRGLVDDHRGRLINVEA